MSLFLQFGNTPEYYLQHRDTLSHKSLLMDFGADETQMDEILSDKGNCSCLREWYRLFSVCRLDMGCARVKLRWCTLRGRGKVNNR